MTGKRSPCFSTETCYEDIADKSPDTWTVNFPAAKGERQSPINIETSKVTFDKTLADNPLKISYQTEKGLPVENTGASFHLHWGAEDDKGAEHLIDGKVYAAEIHLVHWNSTKYKSFGEAADKPDGLAVLCIFVKVGKAHPGFEAVSCQLSKAKCKGDKDCCPSDFDPSCLLPKDTKRYWTYPGSLTTPPCYESVQFIIFQEITEFSPEQMKALRSMKFGDDENSENMVNNFRPPCYIGSRTVRASFPQ
ncbi:hypothetical protein BaRGS_00025684 [Batillaria attramentaria]|uniref:carbonic anhydrase n=1 Tax=Batillaria attramentaria TaxID=370345 RepID=A0ABD0K6Q0_9CAEN